MRARPVLQDPARALLLLPHVQMLPCMCARGVRMRAMCLWMSFLASFHLFCQKVGNVMYLHR